MVNMASNRSPSPLSSRNYRNPGTNSTPRASFNGSPFARPNALINPKSSNPPTPTTDKRNSVNRKSTSSLFQDEKENHKDVFRSPKMGSKNFMAPTISAASKFTPSPRKRILGEANEVARAPVLFLDKDSAVKSEATTTFDQTAKANDDSHESKIVEQKETVVHEVTLNTADESTEVLSGCTEDTDVVSSIRPFCCSPVTSPIIAPPLESDPNLPPYDPTNNFLSPRPRFLRYKPNPRIENILSKQGSDDSGSFDLSENSDTEVEDQKSEPELGDSVHGSSQDLSEKVSKVEKDSKAWGFKGSKVISFVFLMFLVTCFLVPFTDFPPTDLSVYKDVDFSEIYHESLKFAGFAKESFDVLVENVKNWSTDFVSYVLHQKSQLFPTFKTSPIILFNLTTSVQEEFVFNRHIGTDHIQEIIQECEEEMRDETELNEEEEDFVEMEGGDDDIDEVVNEQFVDVQSDDDGFMESKTDLEDGFVDPKSDLEDGFVEPKSNLEDGFVSKSESMYEARSEMEVNDLEIATKVADSNDVTEIMSSMSTNSLNRICLAGLSMVITVVCAIFYMNKRTSNAIKRATIHVAGDSSTCDEESCSSSVGNKQKKKTSNIKRESLAISSSSFSMGSSYGSFTTLERIPIKNKDEVILTPIRRSNRLLKNQVP